jgi:HNH endonuclease
VVTKCDIAIRGQTQHHRIIRTVAPEHEPLYELFLVLATEPAWSGSAVVARNLDLAEQRRQADQSRASVVRRLLAMDRANRAKPKLKGYRPGKSQKRNREFVALLKVLYRGSCQVCGGRIAAPSGDPSAAHVHHFEPWAGDASDRLENVICVCPNHHAMFELKAMIWNGAELSEWTNGEWRSRPLTIDKHLTTKLSD